MQNEVTLHSSYASEDRTSPLEEYNKGQHDSETEDPDSLQDTKRNHKATFKVCHSYLVLF